MGRLSDLSHEAKVALRGLVLKGVLLVVICVFAATAGAALGAESVCQVVAPMAAGRAYDLCGTLAGAELWRVTSYALVVIAVRLALLPLLAWRFVASATAMLAVIEAGKSSRLRVPLAGWMLGSVVICVVCGVSLYTDLTGPRDARALLGYQYFQRMSTPAIQAALMLVFLPAIVGIVMNRYWGKSGGASLMFKRGRT